MALDPTWHDVECGGYTADLPLWLEAAEHRACAVLDIGCGTGRVALALAGAGADVTAVDIDPALVRVLSARARARGLRVDAVVADARTLSLGRSFALAIAPMQVVQLLGGSAGRRSMLASVRRHLLPGGILAVALADPFEAVDAADARAPLPDVLEQDGWVYSSTPISVRANATGATIERVRQAVSPAGELDESFAAVVLDEVPADILEREGRESGYEVLPRHEVPATPDYVGSTVVRLRSP